MGNAPNVEEDSAGQHKLEEVDSEDIPATTTSQQPFIQQLLNRMNPANCLQPAVADAVQACSVTTYKSCVAGEREEFEWLLPGLLDDIKASGKSRTAALQRFYRLVDRDHKENRVPAVSTKKFAAIWALTTCLNLKTPANDRRQALLILNNLCIPTENKAAILFGEAAPVLLSALLVVIRARLAESYLAIVTLVNLSYLADDHAKTMLLNYCPDKTSREAPTTYRYQLPADDPYSLLRTLEAVLKEFVPYLKGHQAVNSVEQQCCRWSMNVIRNLVVVDENALKIARTAIPAQAALCLSFADGDLKAWTKDSLEDASLMLIVHLANRDECLDILTDNEILTRKIVTVCEQLQEAQGIHQTRAVALLERFEEASSARSVGYSV